MRSASDCEKLLASHLRHLLVGHHDRDVALSIEQLECAVGRCRLQNLEIVAEQVFERDEHLRFVIDE